MKEKRLTSREADIMKILWDSEEALSSREISKKKENLTLNTVQATMRTLLKRNLVIADSIGYSGTVLTRKYISNLSEEDYYESLMTKKGISNFLTNFIGKSDNAELDKIEDMIKQKKKEINGLEK
ncbi:BlaI/MecI/CopY family transcriptional regulator [Companilactobacillus nantensis]|uniref:Penicillinase repressor n=1 Tax=Companilactobacillus nantensis DSM 16982 TaxID=1423774 RepID=A0A0R1WEL3_9LACO|nr:BlaI/MecI/CopY family transcriptional regulator [Companilactobacillus nantensis]KRM14137.1 hypothetical protein FD31_GL002206 [Companilactobacillus nantensis DSM 16982]GEO65471.1 hypothetical protein LNA01_26540 [Companilactobacillus nantensis]